MRATDLEPEEIERLRQSIAMLPPRHSAGALTKEAARALIDEVGNARQGTQRYRQAVVDFVESSTPLEGLGSTRW